MSPPSPGAQFLAPEHVEYFTMPPSVHFTTCCVSTESQK